MTASTASTSLTAADLDLVARARKLAAAAGPDGVRKHTGETDSGRAYPHAYGQARVLLAELADLAERLGGAR